MDASVAALEAEKEVEEVNRLDSQLQMRWTALVETVAHRHAVTSTLQVRVRAIGAVCAL